MPQRFDFLHDPHDYSHVSVKIYFRFFFNQILCKGKKILDDAIKIFYTEGTLKIHFTGRHMYVESDNKINLFSL